jgi:RNA polymerase sigma-70 factor (ECF subfamily)
MALESVLRAPWRGPGGKRGFLGAAIYGERFFVDRGESGSVMDAVTPPPTGRKEQFMRLFWPHVDVLYGAAWHMTGRADRAEECVQEALFRAWNYFGTFQDGAEPRPWLLAILRNVIYEASRRRKREVAKVSLSEVGDDSAGEAPGDPAARLFAGEVRRAIHELPAEFRDVVLLAVVEGLQYREVAAALGIPMGTVMSRLHRGRELLRERLPSYASEPRRGPEPGPDGAA